MAKRGRGVMVEDVDGNEFMDFAAGIAVCSTGHCHPHVVAAIQKQAAELIHMSGTDFYYESMAALAERLSKSAPMAGPHKVYYGNSGAEAIEAALKLARYHTKRPYVIAFYNSFHGRTMGALSLTASKVQQRRRYAPVSPGVTHVPYPHTFRRPEGTDAKQYAIDCARFIEEKVLKTTLPPEEVAAIFVEPIQGEGGYVPAPTEFLQELRAICDRHGILLVADEVQSGCGRTGKMWAIQHSGVEPDIICSAKGIASGMPLGVMMSKAHVMDWVPGSHASTFGGNPVCIASALATLDVLEGVGSLRGSRRLIMRRTSARTCCNACRLGWEVRHCGRSTRTRSDDRRGNSERQEDESAGGQRARPHRGRVVFRARRAAAGLRRDDGQDIAAADHHERASGHRDGCAGGIDWHRGRRSEWKEWAGEDDGGLKSRRSAPQGINR